MENTMQVFTNKEFGSIRTVEMNGEPWFVGKDVADALGYKKTENAIATHVDAEDKTSTLIQGDGSNYKSKVILINESGLYSLILQSKLPDARKFKRWVTSEVLPSIRKTGAYASPGVYAPKASSLGEVVRMIETVRSSMKEQGATPREIAKAIQDICTQFGVRLPKYFVQPERLTLNDVYDMIDFAFESSAKGKKVTYEDFVVNQTMKRRLLD